MAGTPSRSCCNKSHLTGKGPSRRDLSRFFLFAESCFFHKPMVYFYKIQTGVMLLNKKLHTLLTILLLSIFLPSTFLLIRKQFHDADGEQAYQEALEVARAKESAPLETTPEATEASVIPTEICWMPAAVEETDPNLEQLQQIDLEALREVNPDVLGWILIPQTKVNYPILQGEDNEYYLNHTWQNNRNYVGSIFLECQNQPDFSDYNTIIYGHNLKNGTMFAAIRNYMSQSFYEAHPSVYLVTDQGIFLYEIFSAHLAPVDSLTYGMVMNQEDTRQEFLDYVLRESVIETPVVPAATDQIITLSTCSGHGYAKRWVIHARLQMIPVIM